MERINRFLDRLPRTSFGRGSRVVPAFRSCGIAGFYVAVATTLGSALVIGVPLLYAAGMCATCGLSFFAYTWLRKWITGHESLVLLEHVWFAWIATTLYARALGEPVLPYLDAAAAGMCFFLAAGRVGCTLVGCCHGRPSAFGITYGENCARDGFARAWVGVRLLPVPAFECLGLVAIGSSVLIALPRAAPGLPFAWTLVSYSVLRFGLEGLRGDRRPHLFGLSQARWMSIVEVVFAIEIVDRGLEHGMELYAALALLLVGSLIVRRRLDPGSRLLAPAHLDELRELARQSCEGSDSLPRALVSSAGVTVAATEGDDRVHLSIGLPGRTSPGTLGAELVARAFPELVPESARAGRFGVTHAALQSRWHERPRPALASAELIERVTAELALTEQRGEPEEPTVDLEPMRRAPAADATPWYFAPMARERSSK